MMLLKPLALHGAEGDDDTGQVPPVDPEPVVDDTDPGPDDQDTFPRSYVEKLRKEAGEWRTKYRDADDQLKERQQAEMSEMERLQTRVTDSEARNTALSERLVEIEVEHALTLEAIGQKFIDPSDAVDLIDVDMLDIDENTGKPTAKSVRDALKKLAEKKPYLVGVANFGSADGATKGTPKPVTQADRIEAHRKRLLDSGHVPLS